MENPTENDRKPDNRAGCAVAVGSALLVAPTRAAIYQPTLNLRWRKPALDPIEALLEGVNGKDAWILQQAWSDLNTGHIEWRDVPKESQPNEKAQP